MRLAARCGPRRWLAVVAALVAAQGAPASDPQRFLFDGRPLLDPGLSLTVARSSDSVDGRGLPVAAGRPRFGPTSLLCGAPEVTTLAGTTGYGNVYLFGAGVLHDNATPALLIFNATSGQLEVVVGFPGGPPFAYNAAPNSLKGGQSDALRDSIDASPDEAWTPRAGIVCHGVAVVMCNVAVRDAQDQFLSNRTGFMTCRLADLAGPKPLWWRRLAVSDVLSPCSQPPRFGNTWSLQSWYSPDRTGEPPTKVWLCATDYRTDPCKDGGAYAVLPLSRPSETSPDWIADAPMELPGRFSLTTFGTHAHAAGLVRFGASGLLVLGARGDSLYNNCDYTWTLDDEADYRRNAAVPAGASNYYTGGDNWTWPKLVNGSISSPSAPIATRVYGNQWVGVAPGPLPGTLITGADEVNQPLWITSDLSTNPDHVEYTPLSHVSRANRIYPPGGSNILSNRFHCFHISAARPQDPATDYAAQIGPGATGAQPLLKARAAYSPDGLTWGQCWAQRENEQASVAIAAGRIYCGSIGTGSGLGIRSIPVPAARAAAPLRIAPGGFNHTPPQLTVRELAPFVSIGDTTPALPAVQSLGACAHVIVGDPGAAQPPANLGVITLAEHVPGDALTARFRLWVRPDPIADGGAAGTTPVQFRLRSTDEAIGESTRVISGTSALLYLPGSGEWTPLVFSSDLYMWGAQDGPSRIDLELVPPGGAWVKNSFQVTVDSFVIGDSLPAPTPGQSDAGTEIASVSGFNLPGDWTVMAAGLTPPDSWDPTFVGSWLPPVVLLSVVDDTGTRSVEVAADVISNFVRAFLVNGDAYETSTPAITGVHLTSESPVLIGLAYDHAAGTITLTCSAAGMPAATTVMTGITLTAPMTSITFGSIRPDVPPGSMDWIGGSVEDRALSSEEMALALRTLSFLKPAPCPSDFDGNGFVNGDDADAFAIAFDIGDAAADFDGNGFVNGDDFDSFAIAFESGC